MSKEQDLSQDQLDQLKQAFQLFDKNNDGLISAKELKEVLTQLNSGVAPSDEEVQDMLSDVDTNGDSCIDWDEFVALMGQKLDKGDAEEEILQAFKVFDKDGNGLIDAEELKLVMKALGETLTDEEIGQMMKSADLNEDGYIDLEEFKIMLGSG